MVTVQLLYYVVHVSKPYRYARKLKEYGIDTAACGVSKPYRYARKSFVSRRSVVTTPVSKPYRYARKVEIPRNFVSAQLGFKTL